MPIDIGILFNVSPAFALLFFKICADRKNTITSEFIKFLEKICLKGDREINKFVRIFSMFYIKELECIYDFCNFIMKLNGKIDDLYEKTKKDLIATFAKTSALHDVFNFIGNIAQKEKFDEEEFINIMRDKFANEDFVKKFLEEFKSKQLEDNDENKYLKLLDGNKCVELINNLDKKLSELSRGGNILNKIDLSLNFLGDHIKASKPLTDALRLALFNFDRQSQIKNGKIFLIISSGETEDLDKDEIEIIKEFAEFNQIDIISIYLNPDKIRTELKFYDSYETDNKSISNLFSVSSLVRYNDPLMNFFILRGWELPSSGEGRFFIEVNDKQNLYNLVDILNDFCAELNNSKSFLNNDSIINSIGSAAINSKVYYDIISQFEAKNQGKTPTCYANAISAGIFITMTKFPSIPQIDFCQLRDEIIEFTKNKENEIKHKDTFQILGKISKKFRLELKVVDEVGARKAIMKTRICITRFGLTKEQWQKFNEFFKKNKKGILEKKHIGKRQKGEKLKGYAVVLTEIFNDHLYFLNSYGSSWGDNGFFRVKNAEVLNAKFLEIYIEPQKYTENEKNEYETFHNNIKNNLSHFLFEDN
jgi:hypothetical protein